VLTFVVLQGKDFDEVARQMDRSPDAVRGLLYRAKKELRAQMGRSSLYLSR
jgi:DNA-directed RNA polymerase specialized sigma24 family protein